MAKAARFLDGAMTLFIVMVIAATSIKVLFF